MLTASTSHTYAHEVGTRLRAVRILLGRSLHQVEAASGGRWKVGVVGSYERGDRMITIEKLAALAAFYDVPLTDLLPDTRPGPLPPRAARVVLNLPALTRLTTADAGPLRRWVASIQHERGDYAGRVLSIRHNDLRALATVYDTTPDQLIDALRRWNALDASSDFRDPATTEAVGSPVDRPRHLPTPPSK